VQSLSPDVIGLIGKEQIVVAVEEVMDLFE
jgi:hypothetical protein